MFCCKNIWSMQHVSTSHMVDLTLSEWWSAYVKQSMRWARSIQTRWPRGGWLWRMTEPKIRNSLKTTPVLSCKCNEIKPSPSRDDMSSRFSYYLIPNMAYIVQNSLLIIEKKNITSITLFFLHAASCFFVNSIPRFYTVLSGGAAWMILSLIGFLTSHYRVVDIHESIATWVSISSMKTCVWYKHVSWVIIV